MDCEWIGKTDYKLEGRKERVLRLYFEAWSKGNIDACDELFTEDFVLHNPPLGDIVGLKNYKKACRGYHESFPDARMEFPLSMQEGNYIMIYFVWWGTFEKSSDIMPYPPTNKKFQSHGCAVCRMEGDKVAEEWGFDDYLGLMFKLGVIKDLPAIAANQRR